MDAHNRSLCAYTIALMLVWLAVIKLGAAVPLTTSPGPPTPTTTRFSNPRLEHKYERNCKALCEHCGCLGFYCGEECICECNNDNSDTECIRTMQTNARQLDVPFEILLQGPSKNCFVRNALQFEQRPNVTERNRNRRSTITIYKPAGAVGTGLASKLAPHAANALEPTKTVKKSEVSRHKRSVDHLEWFNDFANTLTRPAPLGTRAARQREVKAAKRQSVLDRDPWFLEQTAPRLTRPAPLQKRQQENRTNRRTNKTKMSMARKVSTPPDSLERVAPTAREIRPLRDALDVVERIPRVIQDTVTNLADSNSGDVFSLNIMNDVFPKAMTRTDHSQMQLQRRQSALDLLRKNNMKQPVMETPEAPEMPQRGLFLPWLRQRRMRQRRQQGRAAAQ